jgi:hypothetical protein
VVPHKSASVDGKSKPRLDDVIYVRKEWITELTKRIREWLDEGYEYEDILVLVPSLEKAPWSSNYNTFWDVKRYLRINQILTIRSQAMILI